MVTMDRYIFYYFYDNFYYYREKRTNEKKKDMSLKNYVYEQRVSTCLVRCSKLTTNKFPVSSESTPLSIFVQLFYHEFRARLARILTLLVGSTLEPAIYIE